MKKNLFKLDYIDTATDRYFQNGSFHPVPRDENGNYTVSFLKDNGVDIIKSELVQEMHIELSHGRPYAQKMRKDTFSETAPREPITFFYHFTRGNAGFFPIND
jgi:hypothetical protein